MNFSGLECIISAERHYGWVMHRKEYRAVGMVGMMGLAVALAFWLGENYWPRASF